MLPTSPTSQHVPLRHLPLQQGMGLDLLVLQGELIVAMDQLGAQPRSSAPRCGCGSCGNSWMLDLWNQWILNGSCVVHVQKKQLVIPIQLAIQSPNPQQR